MNVPVTPSKSLDSAKAFLIACASVEPAVSIAFINNSAASYAKAANESGVVPYFSLYALMNA